MKQKIKYITGLLVPAICLLLSSPVFAATIALRPLVAKVNAGAVFTVSVDVNTQGKTINNAEAAITFPKDLVEVTSLNSGGSIFSIWVEQPAFSNADGSVTFNGGVPNPGYTGSNGHILSVQFKSIEPGTARFDFTSAAVRENDGLGTNILSGQSGASISITKPVSPAPTPAPPQVPAGPGTELERLQKIQIVNYSESIREGQRITANGTGPQNSAINIELVTQDGIARTYTTTSTDAGIFSFRSEPIAGAGLYEMWAQSVLPGTGLESVSGHVNISVSPSAVAELGFVVRSWFTIPNIIIALLSILGAFGWLNYLMLKKNLRLSHKHRNSESNPKKP